MAVCFPITPTNGRLPRVLLVLLWEGVPVCGRDKGEPIGYAVPSLLCDHVATGSDQLWLLCKRCVIGLTGALSAVNGSSVPKDEIEQHVSSNVETHSS